MFLILMEFLQCIWNTINCILSWIENYPVTMGGLVAVIGGSIWFRRFLRQKRAEAFFGFYSRLLFCLKSLRTWLDERELLESDNRENGNIYTLMYGSLDNQRDKCPAFKLPTDEELKELKELVERLKETLFDTENNVYPKPARFSKKEEKKMKEQWYESQQILFEFCEFILRENKAEIGAGNHTDKCIALKKAMDEICTAIKQAEY